MEPVSDSLYIVMPAYNEEANIEEVVRSWYANLEGKGEGSRLLVADSGSTDRTHEILVEMAASMPKLVVLSGTDKMHGPKLMAMYDYAVKQGADYVFQTDSDGQTNPDEFAGFWNHRHKYEAIIGYRPVRGDGKSRAFVEDIVCFMLWIIFGVKVKDANAPFRLFRTDVLSEYISRLPYDYALPNIMLTAYFVYYHRKTAFHEISFRERQGGKNSINICKIIRIGFKSVFDFIKFRREM